MSESPVMSPTPAHITVLLKHARSTTVLSVLPETSLTTLKSHLLQVLSERNITTLPGTNVPLPTEPSELELGVLLDRHEPYKGWVYAEDRASLDTAAATSKSSGRKKNKGLIETVGDLELKDGAWIAYRVRWAGSAAGGDDEDEKADLIGDPGWNVEFPSFDEEEPSGNGAFGGGSDGFDADGRNEGDDEDEDHDMDIPTPVPRNAVAR